MKFSSETITALVAMTFVTTSGPFASTFVNAKKVKEYRRINNNRDSPLVIGRSLSKGKGKGKGKCGGKKDTDCGQYSFNSQLECANSVDDCRWCANPFGITDDDGLCLCKDEICCEDYSRQIEASDDSCNAIKEEYNMIGDDTNRDCYTGCDRTTYRGFCMTGQCCDVITNENDCNEVEACLWCSTSNDCKPRTSRCSCFDMDSACVTANECKWCNEGTDPYCEADINECTINCSGFDNESDCNGAPDSFCEWCFDGTNGYCHEAQYVCY